MNNSRGVEKFLLKLSGGSLIVFGLLKIVFSYYNWEELSDKDNVVFFLNKNILYLMVGNVEALCGVLILGIFELKHLRVEKTLLFLIISYISYRISNYLMSDGSSCGCGKSLEDIFGIKSEVSNFVTLGFLCLYVIAFVGVKFRKSVI